LIHCIINYFPGIFGNYIREKADEQWRFDFVMKDDSKIYAILEIDGKTHFLDWPELGTIASDVRTKDLQKMLDAFSKHGDLPYIRLHQASTWNGYPVSAEFPITFDAPSAIKHVMDLYKGQKVCIFIEPAGCTDYAAHKADCDANGIRWVSIDARECPGIVPDARTAIFMDKPREELEALVEDEDEDEGDEE